MALCFISRRLRMNIGVGKSLLVTGYTVMRICLAGSTGTGDSAVRGHGDRVDDAAKRVPTYGVYSGMDVVLV